MKAIMLVCTLAFLGVASAGILHPAAHIIHAPVVPVVHQAAVVHHAAVVAPAAVVGVHHHGVIAHGVPLGHLHGVHHGVIVG